MQMHMCVCLCVCAQACVCICLCVMGQDWHVLVCCWGTFWQNGFWQKLIYILALCKSIEANQHFLLSTLQLFPGLKGRSEKGKHRTVKCSLPQPKLIFSVTLMCWIAKWPIDKITKWWLGVVHWCVTPRKISITTFPPLLSSSLTVR